MLGYFTASAENIRGLAQIYKQTSEIISNLLGYFTLLVIFANMRWWFVAIFYLISAINIHGQRFRVATWNIENAFDTIHDKGKDDMEFLPTAERKWHSGRYWHKLRGITQTIAAMELPALIGIQEVENDTVLRDLTRRTALWSARYKFVMTDCDDTRGVDVALLYKPEIFQLFSWHAVRIPSTENGLLPTRDILVASGIVGKDTLNICVVHLPSRRNNNRATKLNRALAVQTLCHTLDSLQGQKTLVIGDFNAEPGDKIFDSLGRYATTLLPTDKKTLYDKRGTYYFRGEWGFLDHILASKELHHYSIGEAEECRFTWLLRTSKQIPHRTYGGNSYLGGISDHLPLICDFELRR